MAKQKPGSANTQQPAIAHPHDDSYAGVLERFVASRKHIGFLILSLIALVVFHTAFLADFFWDDRLAIYENPIVTNPQRWQALLDIWFSHKDAAYWPLTTTVYWVCWQIWGKNPVPLHTLNLMVFVANAYLAWRILVHLRIKWAFLIASLFLVHPVNAEIPPWAIQLKTTLATLFMLAALMRYLQFYENACEDSKLRWQAVVLFICSLLSKTSAILFPFVALGAAFWKKGKISLKDLGWSAPLFVASLIFGLLGVTWDNHLQLAPEDLIRTDGFVSRIVTAGLAVVFYISKVIYPVDVSFMYPYWKVDPYSFLDWIPLLSLIAVLILSIAYIKSWGRPVLFSLGFFLLMIFPALGFYNIYFMRYSLVADHWQYHGMIAVLAPFILLIDRGLQKHKILFSGVVTSFFAIYAFISHQHSAAFQTPERIYLKTLHQNPSAWMIYNNLGQIYSDRGDMAKAIENYQASIRLKPNHKTAYTNLGNLHLKRNQPDRAVQYFEQVLRINASDADALAGFCGVNLLQGNNEKARTFCEKAIESIPHHETALLNLANTYVHAKDYAKAEEILRRALEAHPNSSYGWNGLGNALYQQEKFLESFQAFQTAVAINPHHLKAVENLALMHFSRRDLAQARTYALRAVSLDPQSKVKFILEQPGRQ